MSKSLCSWCIELPQHFIWGLPYSRLCLSFVFDKILYTSGEKFLTCILVLGSRVVREASNVDRLETAKLWRNHICFHGCNSLQPSAWGSDQFLWYNFLKFLLQGLIGLLCHLWQALQLDNCSLLTSVSLDLPHLKNISLVHLRKWVKTGFALYLFLC